MSVLQWTFILLLFIYLFVLVVALFDVMAFQRLVSEQVGGDASRQRAVLVKVGELRRQAESRKPSVDPELREASLNYGSIAIRMDQIRHASRMLGQLRGIKSSEVPLTELLAKARQLEETMNERQATVIALKQRSDKAGEEKIDQTETGRNLQDELEEAEKLATDAAKEHAAHMAELKVRVQDGYLRAVGVIGEQVAGLRDDLQELKGFEAADALITLQRQVSLLAPLSLERKKDEKGDADVAPAGATPPSPLGALASAQEVNDLGRAMAAELALLGPIVRAELENSTMKVASEHAQLDAAAAWLAAFKPADGQFVELDPGDAGDPREFTKVRRDMEEALQGIASSLSRIDSFRDARLIAGPAAELEAVARWLKRSDTSEARLLLPATSGEAISTFEQAVDLLSKGLAELGRNLSPRSEVEQLEEVMGDAPDLGFKANLIWTEFNRLGLYRGPLLPFSANSANAMAALPAGTASSWFSWAPELGIDPLRLATMTNRPLTMMLVFIIGAIGSLIFIAKHQLMVVLQGGRPGSAVARPFSWYVFRPIFGVVVAFAVFLLYSAGQIALGGGVGRGIDPDMNIWILCVISLFAGLLSWQALSLIESRGSAWLKGQERTNLWASGLDASLRATARSPAECATHVGVSPAQIERWIACIDKVTPEMQDRIITWLDRPRTDIFTDVQPRNALHQRALWATGLASAMTVNGNQLDAAGLAELLDVEPQRVERWIRGQLQVSPAMQWRLVDILRTRHSELFNANQPAEQWWAVGLRRQLAASGLRRAEVLAPKLNTTTEIVHSWMELDAEVPAAMQTDLMRILRVGHSLLFAKQRPEKPGSFAWAVRLRDLMEEKGQRAADLASLVDTEVLRVHAWMELDEQLGAVAPATQRAVEEALGASAAEGLFAPDRPIADTRWVTPLLVDLVAARGLGDFAAAVDVDTSRVGRWLNRQERVVRATQERIASVLKQPREKLFTPVRDSSARPDSPPPPDSGADEPPDKDNSAEGGDATGRR